MRSDGAHAADALTHRIASAAPGLAFAPAASFEAGQAARTPIEVWKHPGCGCCKDLTSHLEATGFAVKASETGKVYQRYEGNRS